MKIESFLPGRLRISSNLFLLPENVERAKKLALSHAGVKSVTANTRIGSLTVLYDPRVVTMESLMEYKQKFEAWEKEA